MRKRSKFFLIIAVGLGGFLASRPDIRKNLLNYLENVKVTMDEAIDKGMQEAKNKERELTLKK